MVRLDLRDLVAGAADLYAGSGNEIAARAAALMRSAPPHRPSAPPKGLAVLDYLHDLVLPGVEFIQRSAADLPWTDGGFTLPESISGRNAFAELIGPEGPLLSKECRFGFYLQAPHCLYPLHSHAAEELYLVLSGAPEWRLEGGQSFVPSAPGLVHHLPWQRHEMRTRQTPLLALWVWLGDIRYATYSI